jgi:hypothetical protein
MGLAGSDWLGCPRRDALKPARSQFCASCQEHAVRANSPDRAFAKPAGPWTMSLRTVMALSALVAVGMSVTQVSVTPSNLITAVVSFAVLRSASAAFRRRCGNSPMSPSEFATSFGRSLGLFVVIGTAAGGVFLIMCVTGLMGGAFLGAILAEHAESASVGFTIGIEVGFWAGVAAGLSLFVILTRRFWQAWE